MRNMYRIKAFSTMSWWIACSIFVWPLAAVSVAAIAIPIGMVLRVFDPGHYSPFYNSYEFIFTGVVALIAGAMIGSTMSHLQRWLLRTKLYWAADNWRKWTVIGAVVAALVLLFLNYVVDAYIPYQYLDLTTLLILPVFITIISAFQYLSLRHAVKDAWLWILANAVAGIVFSGLVYNNQPTYYDPNREFRFLSALVLAPLVLGAITGYVMLFLFEQKVLPMKPENEELVDPNKPKSIWDDAI